MPDILSRLAVVNGSHESFHSTRSSPGDGPTGQKTPDIDTTALQAAGVSVYDVDTYLNDPNVQLLLEEAVSTKKGKASSSRKDLSTGSSSTNVKPVQLGGPKTSHHVKLLHEICQSSGLQAEFKIEGDQTDFGGSISINGETIHTDDRWRSKKEAKEGLAEKGMELVREMARNARPKPAATADAQVNWIGKLLEYCNATSPTQGPTYTDYGVGSHFACTCTIPGNTIVFGGTSNAFPSKKAARVNAAKEALQSLITAGLVEADGSLKAKKKAKIGTAVKIEDKGIGVTKNTTYAQRVNDLCPILGLAAPTYQIKALSPDAPNIVSGSAVFPSQPLFPKPLGEVRNIYGKKNAKEECAKGVWETLSALARSRGIQIDEVEEDD